LVCGQTVQCFSQIALDKRCAAGNALFQEISGPICE
jgi:hypothetical protein